MKALNLEPVQDGSQQRNNDAIVKTLNDITKLFLTGKTTAPTADDDITKGIAIGAIWTDETNNKTYCCQDNARGAAVWGQIGGAGAAVLG